jgi:putative LysE/RhtB family amino acid efflux pump
LRNGAARRYHRGMNVLALGFGFGFVVAAQIGPMSLFMIRSTLASGLRVGLAIGAGIATVDAVYAAAGAAGAAPLLAIGPLRTIFGLLGAAVILALGVRTLLHARRPPAESGRAPVDTPRRAFLVSLAATSANPATIASWAAVFAAAGAAGAGSPVLLVAGVGLGSLAWVSLLATGAAGARRTLGERVIRAADVVAGAGLLLFAGVLAASAV